MISILKKGLLLLTCFHFISTSSQYQSGPQNLNINTPLSPNSAAFEKYGIVPVNLSSGTITPSVPIYTIPIGKNKFSINFNYSSQGLRVDEHPTNIGMGWSLNLGSITRTVKDLPDDSSTPFYNLSPPIIGDDNFWIGSNIAETITTDSERDIFTVNVDGMTTKFIIINNEIVKITLDNIDIRGGGDYFIVTSKEGVEYYFGDGNAFEETKSKPTVGTFMPPTFSRTSYLLNGIKYPDGNKLDIKYSKSRIEYKDNVSQSALIKFGLPDNTHSSLPTINNSGINTLSIETDMAVPLSIETGEIVIDFVSSNFNYYIQGFPSIDHIDIRHKEVLRSRIQLTYDRYTSISTGNNSVSKSVQRPFLSKIQLQDVDFNEINEYKFEYYNPDQLPHRLSFSQDIVGYFNGVNNNNFIFNSLLDYNYMPDYSVVKDNKEDFNNFVFNVAGNRKPDANFAKNGLLKKIIYPTKGFTEFIYEGNFTDIPAIVYPPYHIDSILFDPPEWLPGSGSTIKEITVPFNQRLYLQYSTSYLNDFTECSDDTQHQNGLFNIYHNGTILEHTEIYENGNTKTEIKSIPINSGYHAFSDSQSPKAIYFELEAGKIYRLKLDSRGCYVKEVFYKARLHEPYAEGFVEAGGLRIKTVENYDSNSNPISNKSFQYSTGKYAVDKPLSTLNRTNVVVAILGSNDTVIDLKEVNNYTLSSAPRWPLRNLSGEFYVYDTVEEKDNAFTTITSKGKIIHEFTSPNVFLPYSVQNYDTSSSNISTETYSTNEVATSYYDDQNSLMKVDSMNYKKYPTNIKFFDYTAVKALDFKCANNDGSQNNLFNCPGSVLLQQPLNDDRWWSIMKSYNTQYWNAIESKTTTDFLNGNPLVTTTEYFYNNPLHYQLTTEKTTYPDLSTKESKYQYAHEKGNQKLIDANMVGVILETTSFKNNKALSKVETTYPDQNNFPTTQAGNLLLPLSVRSTRLPTISILNPPVGEIKETEVNYDFYDNNGNLLQYTAKSGIPTTIIWGYNQTQPIAKIEGATYAQVANLAAAIITASNDDALQPANNDETSLLATLDTFRQSLSNYQVTTYTYDPLVGVRSITPPIGIREYYIYDTANRLQSVKDIDGKILKEYQYNYKP